MAMSDYTLYMSSNKKKKKKKDINDQISRSFGISRQI